MKEILYIVTDGSAIGNPGPGGWAAVLNQGRRSWEISGGDRTTTSSEMELVAAVRALEGIQNGTKIELRSDSRLLIDGMRFYVRRWKKDGWSNRRGKKLQHQDLWLELLRLDERLHIRWRWVRGHNQHPTQCRADSLAYQEARTLWRQLRLAA
jgi:ribonuclease HI